MLHAAHYACHSVVCPALLPGCSEVLDMVGTQSLAASINPDGGTARGRRNVGYVLGQVMMYNAAWDTEDQPLGSCWPRDTPVVHSSIHPMHYFIYLTAMRWSTQYWAHHYPGCRSMSMQSASMFRTVPSAATRYTWPHGRPLTGIWPAVQDCFAAKVVGVCVTMSFILPLWLCR